VIGLDWLALSIVQTHPFKRTTRTASEKPGATLTMSTTAEKMRPAKKEKIASLMPAAQANSAQQAELTFDVNSFNF
jgi:hypothetical protein